MTHGSPFYRGRNQRLQAAKVAARSALHNRQGLGAGATLRRLLSSFEERERERLLGQSLFPGWCVVSLRQDTAIAGLLEPPITDLV